jgi:hypothetical protein
VQHLISARAFAPVCIVVYSGEIRKPEKFSEESSDEEEDLENVLQADRERVEVEERDRLQRQR